MEPKINQATPKVLQKLGGGPPRDRFWKRSDLLMHLVALWLTFATLLVPFGSILVSVLVYYVENMPRSARIRQAPPKGMTAIYRLGRTTKTIQALQDPNGGAAVSRLWRTSINPPPLP